MCYGWLGQRLVAPPRALSCHAMPRCSQPPLTPLPPRLPQKESKVKQAERAAAAKQQLSVWDGERFLMHMLRANLETCR